MYSRIHDEQQFRDKLAVCRARRRHVLLWGPDSVNPVAGGPGMDHGGRGLVLYVYCFRYYGIDRPSFRLHL